LKSVEEVVIGTFQLGMFGLDILWQRWGTTGINYLKAYSTLRQYLNERERERERKKTLKVQPGISDSDKRLNVYY